MVKKDPGDNYSNTGASGSLAHTATGVRNQEIYSTDTAFCDSYGYRAPCRVRQTSLFYPFRGVEMWGSAGYISDGVTYPNYYDQGYIPCSWNDLP